MSVKQEAIQTLIHLPDTASWNDVLYTLYVKQKTEKGLTAIREGNVVTHEEAKLKLLAQ
jgi:predicted transcriptional regulator